jgi:hypothetical protein
VKSNDTLFQHTITRQNEVLNELRSRPCEGCLKGKMKRTAMTGKIDYFIEDKMDLWVFDTMIVSHETMGGCKYITTVVDVYTTKSFVALHKSKSDIALYLINLITLYQTQTGLTLKHLHSDNGTEVCTSEVSTFLHKQGTIHTTSTIHTPQHNSIVERKQRTLIESSRSMLHHAHAPFQLYGESTLYSAYVLDRTLNTHHHNMTPYEHFNDRVPDISHLHVWGCDASYYIHKKHRVHKFDAKSVTGIFIGVDDHNDTYYRILNIDTMNVIRTRDVVFNEGSFEQMKILFKSLDDEMNVDNETKSNTSTININDYLPDSLFMNSEAVASMFDDQAVSKKKNTNDNNDHNNNNTNESNNEMNSSTSSSKRHKRHSSNVLPERKSTRVTAVPDRLAMMSSSSSSTLHRSYRMDPNDYAMIVLDEPISYVQAMQCNESDRWQQAMNEELGAHQKNKTWSIVEQTGDMNVIGCRWVFKIKRDSSGAVSKYKARLVAKGYSQQYGIDFHDTFAPVLKYKTLRIMIVLSLHFDMCMEQLDVKTAFLNATVKENIYVQVPEGMSVKSGCVLKLQKALYGIKQAPREWHEEIDKYLHFIGYKSCIKDSCLYLKISRTHRIILIGLFVDDITSLFHLNDKAEWIDDRTKLKAKYDLTELGELHHILGMNVDRQSSSVITITQNTYINDKLNLFDYHKCKTAPTPGIATNKIIDSSSISLSPTEIQTYQMMVGSLIYASISTRPDITHATNIVARHMSSPTHHDMSMVKRIFRYLSGNRNHGLTYTRGQNREAVELTGYCDADWGGDLIDRRSTTGQCTLMNGNLISWQTKKQTTVANSTAEAEYMAIADVARELMWMRQLLSELGISIVTPSIIYSDNQPAIRISENDSDHDRTKHIDIKHHFIRDLVKNKEIKLEWISTTDQLADIFTKALGINTFMSLRDRLMHSDVVHNM